MRLCSRSFGRRAYADGPQAAALAGSALLALLTLLTSAQPALAFCRETTETMATGPCTEPVGAPRLHWTRSCMTYVFNDQTFDAHAAAG